MPILVDEVHYSKAALFDEFAEDREVILVRHRGVLVPAWEDLKEHKSKPYDFASRSTNAPRPTSLWRRGRAGGESLWKIKIADCRTAYVLYGLSGQKFAWIKASEEAVTTDVHP